MSSVLPGNGVNLQKGMNQVESLQLLILQESALKEELLHAGESLQQSLSVALARLKDACSAEPERSGGWLLEHVWHFCDDLQAQQKSMHRTRSSGALADTLASVRRRRGGLMDELRHQVQQQEELEQERQQVFQKEQQIHQRMEKCTEEIISLRSHDCNASLEQFTLDFNLQEASKFQKLDAEFKDVLARAKTEQKKKKDEILQQLVSTTVQLQQLANQILHLRQKQKMLDSSVRAELSQGKDTLRRCGAALLEGITAGWRQMSVLSLSAEEHVQALQKRLAAREQAGIEQLERQQKEALAIAEQAEHLKTQATQEISRLLNEQSISEKQRSANASNASRTITHGSGQSDSVIAHKTVGLAKEATQARTRVLIDERERLESLCGAERLFEAQQSLQEALAQNEQLRRDLDLARLREQQSHADAADADTTAHRKRCEEILEKEQAEIAELEQHLRTQEANLAPLSREQSRLKMQVSNALVENATLERERGLWKAQYELQQKLRQEVEEAFGSFWNMSFVQQDPYCVQAMEQARAAWKQERDEIKEDISRSSQKLLRMKAEVAQTQESPREATWSEQRQLEQELQEVERCLSAVTSTLAQHSAARRQQQSDADARLRTVWQRLDRLQQSVDLELRPLMPDPSTWRPGLKKKPEYNGKKVQLISKEPGWWVCRAVDGVTLRVKEIHLVPRETRREEGDKEETHIHEKEMPKRQPKIPELGPNLKTFVINLKRRPDRRESIEALCKELKLNYEIVEACDGRALSQQPDARFEIVRSSSASPSSSARPQQTPEVASSSSKRNVDKVKVKKVKAKKVAASKMTRTQRAQATKKVAAHLAKNPKAEVGKPKPAESSKGKPMGFSNLTLRRFRAHFQWNGRSSQLIRMAMHRVQSSDKTQKGHELWGAIGCNISHQIVLQQILDDPKLEYALILEDDCIKGKDTEEIRRIFNENIRKIDEVYKWQLIYLGGSICTKYRSSKNGESTKMSCEHKEIMQNLQEGFAADAAFVSWLRKEWGSGNTGCCFLFEPQLLTQPGNETRWKDSDIFAEGAYFREAFEEKGEQYSFSRACDLRKKIKKQTIDRKEDVNDEQTVYHMDEEGKFKADIEKDKKKKTKKQDEEERTKKEAIKNEPEERKRKESVKMKVGKEEEDMREMKKQRKKEKEKRTEKLQEEQDATDKTTEASKVRKSRKAKELNVEEAEPVQPRKRAKKAKLRPLEDEIDEPLFTFKSSSARDPSGGELEQPLEDWESEDQWQEHEGDRQEEHEVQDDEQSPALDEEIEQPGQTSKEDDLESQALALLQRHQEAPAFLKAMQNAGQQKMEMQKLFTKKTSKKGPVEELKEQLILIVKGARLNVGMVQDALTAAVSAAAKDGMIGRLRSTVEKLHNKVFYRGYRNKLIDCFMCALEFHCHAAMREDFSTECAKELQAYLGKGESAAYGIVVEASTGLLSTLLEKVKAARAQLKAAEQCQDDLLQLIEGHKERSLKDLKAESAAPLPHSMPSMDRPGSRKRLRPCPSDPGRCDSARLSFAVPSPPSTDSEGDTSLDPVRKDLQNMSIKELRKKVAELNIPHDVARNFLDKDEVVEACTVLFHNFRVSVPMPRVEIKVILDFMCPWSFIGLRSMQLAKERFASRLDFTVELIPFEFDPPGKYPPEGTDWVEYCKSYGPAKAKFLLEEKLPRAFAIGKELGIEFRLERRIVHTVDVNTALLVAQRHDVAERFAAATLAAHFEQLQDPNDARALASRLEALNVAPEELSGALKDPQKEAENWKRSQELRASLRSGVPQFEIRCGGADLCLEAAGGPTSPTYFEEIFEKCLLTPEL
eukprot:symbB.v1.2.026340.t1/scaffold2624.1/size74584/2